MCDRIYFQNIYELIEACGKEYKSISYHDIIVKYMNKKVSSHKILEEYTIFLEEKHLHVYER